MYCLAVATSVRGRPKRANSIDILERIPTARGRHLTKATGLVLGVATLGCRRAQDGAGSGAASVDLACPRFDSPLGNDFP